MVIRQGEVYWINLPGPKKSEPEFRRPCVVVQNDTFNRSHIKTTIICILTTNLRLGDAPGNVLLIKGEGNLPKDSVVNISQILTVNKTDLLPEEKIGQLSASKIDLIVSGLRTIF
ncbi:type II toxin-antitoxin system PemK/MazF family toxin [Pleurocapsa sp. CCALA 161]|uniref:type II toxin-antitoxin system PemK/MazF family toxin n=1 Tax=Pleurocapsa sp. CCALA 161 TaxID=2107688 RepID=UPI000D06D6B5|nr:type II toxin-antitoxin system PemK/MazF family toxin [Pleurocapsa sp. CCALA 161]PSB06553.1 type II toxin-antitoxin system PemK/MazF family toxin [Pleurocapsa sp. CCALA 161]